MKKEITIIGGGFSSLSAACYLAKAGYKVVLLEKNTQVGGRARRLTKDGFTFDIGPTWYWMPDVFESFFNDFDKKPSDYYQLEKLNPAYRVYFGKSDFIDIPDNPESIAELFEKNEKGSGAVLNKFLAKSADNYKIAINKLVYKPGVSPIELITKDTIVRLPLFFKSISKQIRGQFKSKKLQQIMEFPVLFLGAKPTNTPAFYNFMNYADFGLGTWHPKKGMYVVIEAMENLAKSLGVEILTDQNVEKIETANGVATSVIVNGKRRTFDLLLSGADYAHTETLLDKSSRGYSSKSWEKKTFAPSSLLFYVGFDKKIENIQHHTLFFDTDFEEHARTIYDDPCWPSEPMFYASFPSQTDSYAAPEGKEAATFLIPIAPGIEDTEELREKYFKIIIKRLEVLTDQKLESSVLFKESFCINDFIKDYNSYKGNAYGLANTLLQTAFLRPKLKSKKVDNLFFTGQLTVPGPGVPPSLISGKVVAEQILKQLK
jgi:phytoene desaturase